MPSCDATRDQLEEYRRGELPPDARAAVEDHLARCAACRGEREREDAWATLVRGLPRTPAPPSLRQGIVEAGIGHRPPVRWFARPWVAAALAAAAVGLVLAPWVRFGTDRPVEAIEALLRSGVAEHRRILLQLETRPEGTGDPAPLFERVQSVTGIELPPALGGVGDFRLLTARPTLLVDRKTAAAALGYPTSPATTYFLFPGQDLPVPAEHRVQIEQYRPYMRQIDEFYVIYWKQGDLAYLMVSGLDDEHVRELFLEMRKAL